MLILDANNKGTVIANGPVKNSSIGETYKIVRKSMKLMNRNYDIKDPQNDIKAIVISSSEEDSLYMTNKLNERGIEIIYNYLKKETGIHNPTAKMEVEYNSKYKILTTYCNTWDINSYYDDIVGLNNDLDCKNIDTLIVSLSKYFSNCVIDSWE